MSENNEMTAVQEEVRALRDRLQAQRAKVKRSQVITGVIGGALILFILIYFQWIQVKTREMLVPEDLAGIVSDYAVKRMPEFREDLEGRALTMAPALVDRIVDNIIDQRFPNLRHRAVTIVKKEAETHLDEFQELMELALQDLVDSYQEDIERLVSQLETEEGRVAMEQEFYELIIASIDDREIRISLDTYREALFDIVSVLAHLAEAPEGVLREDELAVRNLVASIREMAERSPLEGGLLHFESEVFELRELAE